MSLEAFEDALKKLAVSQAILHAQNLGLAAEKILVHLQKVKRELVFDMASMFTAREVLETMISGCQMVN